MVPIYSAPFPSFGAAGTLVPISRRSSLTNGSLIRPSLIFLPQEVCIFPADKVENVSVRELRQGARPPWLFPALSACATLPLPISRMAIGGFLVGTGLWELR